MSKVHRVETYLSPLHAGRLVGVRGAVLWRYVRHGLLNHYRTEGGHRRYALSELRALRGSLPRQRGTLRSR